MPISLSYSGSCNELSASVPLKREFKRFINYLAEDLVSESVLKYHAELFIFDIILIYPIEYKSQIKDITSSIAKTVELFVLELGLESSEYRINIKVNFLNFNTYKHHFLEDLPKIQSSLDQDLDIIHELNRELEIDHSSYIFETEKFVFNMIFLNKTGINEVIIENSLKHYRMNLIMIF